MNHPSNKITTETLDALFTYHRPTPEMVVKFDAITAAAKALALAILENCPDCAQRSAALRHVVAVRMEANATIACDPANAAVPA